MEIQTLQGRANIKTNADITGYANITGIHKRHQHTKTETRDMPTEKKEMHILQEYANTTVAITVVEKSMGQSIQWEMQ